MAPTTYIRALAAGFLCTALPLTSASALHPRQQQGSPGRPWVSVDADGNAHTFSRVVSTIEGGATTTLDAQPYSLTGTVYTLIDPAGETYTTTGNPPPPRATDSNGGRGYFRPCLEGSNVDITPFCQPRNGATLYQDVPYYITWDANKFPKDPDSPVWFQLFNVSSDGSNPIREGTFHVPLMRSIGIDNKTKMKQGYHIWTPTEADLNGQTDFQNITIRMVWNSTDNGSGNFRMGGTVALRPKDQMPRDVPSSDEEDDDSDSGGGGGGGGPPIAAIVVPIVFVVLAIMGVGAWLLIRKRRQGADVAAAAVGTRGRPPQHGQKPGADIELTTSPTSPRDSGRNVFQEEVERQNRERGPV